MPLQSVELVLDAESDEAVRGLWDVLSGKGIRSQADHAGPTNAPHVTLASVPAVTPAAEQALVPLTARLPLRLELDGPVLLGERRPALVLPVTGGTALDALHAVVSRSLGGVPAEDTLPWFPHITLARRLRAEEVQEALALVQSANTPARATATGLRRWDPDVRKAWLVG